MVSRQRDRSREDAGLKGALKQLPKLIIFDVDGTLVDANPVDNDCFDRAFREVTGIPLTAEHWEKFNEVTARAIVHQALGTSRADLPEVETRVQELFLEHLRDSHRRDANAIRPFAGAVDILRDLDASPDFRVAIATGCWRPSAQFKLGSAGFDISALPFACSSDCYGRAEIISLAAQRAGVPVNEAIYVGDGVWDLKATQKLEIPFIGVGSRLDKLRAAGAKHVLPKWEMPALLELLCNLQP
jgi:phosphoglycolate phosphatase-like HAD superfamily hydrolase